jgi:hypothetical protein
MLLTASQFIVLALGALVAALCVWGILAPDKIMALVHGAMEKDWGFHVAVLARLLLGAALIIAAPESRFPVIFETILLMGRERLRKFVAWFQKFSQLMIRVWLLFGIAFGAFLVYGVNWP